MPTELQGTIGNEQSAQLEQFGEFDENNAPPDANIAVGPTQAIEVTDEAMYVYSSISGQQEWGLDLNTFVNGNMYPSYIVSDVHVIYDAPSGRFFLSELDTYRPQIGSCGDYPSFDIVLVSPSSTVLDTDLWTGFEWAPFKTVADGLTGVQPGLGISSNLIASTMNADDTCDGTFNENELLVVQKSDVLDGNFSVADSTVDFFDGPESAQPVDELGANPTQYVVWNNSDALEGGCTPTCSIGVNAVQGTPEAGNVTISAPIYEPMTPTAVQCSTTCSNPPASQEGTTGPLQTGDDHFLNAVWSGNTIWTADGTTCTPSGDTTPRSCLDFVSVQADTSGDVAAGAQINNVGIAGASLAFPAVGVDAAGDMIAVFDESSATTYPAIEVAAVDRGTTTLTSFTTVISSDTYYALCAQVNNAPCAWGNYSGAAVDPSDLNDVWVVGEIVSGNAVPDCSNSPHLCWDTWIARYTFSGPTISAVTPTSGPVAGGQTVTVTGDEFAAGATVTFDGAPIAISYLTPESFTLTTPQHATAGGAAQIQVTDAIGASTEDAESAYTYVGLANFVPVTPFRILDTRTPGEGGAIGAEAVRALQVTGVGTSPIPSTATAAVLNVTEVNGTAASLLTVYPFGPTRPTASNLNFPAHTTMANLVTVTLGPGGKADIYNSVGSVNVVVDVEGYLTPQPVSDVQGLFHPISPVRVCDTRHRSPTPACSAHGALNARSSMVVVVSSATGIPATGAAEAAVVNLTGVQGTAATYLTLFPTSANGTCRYGPSQTPPSSTINLVAGAVQANRVMVELGPSSSGGNDDAVCVYNSTGSINFLIDVNGWYGSATAPTTPAGYQYQAIEPDRVCDTRVAEYGSCDQRAPDPILGGTSHLVQIAGVPEIPGVYSGTLVVAVIANLTAITPTESTYLTLYPAVTSHPPTVSDLNVGAGAVLPNLAVVELTPNEGDVALYNSVGSVNAIVDVEGWFQ
ncbi:MAG TPA: IPT/TIG domain-containing protein [Candidatus Dormibacteraeota bacterium]